MSRIIVEIIIEPDAFAALRGDWKRLFVVSECAPFLSWEWQTAWFKNFGADRSPFILTVKRETELIGILPLCLQEKKVLGMNLKRLAFIGEANGGADYLDLIAKREDKAEILAAIFEFLKAENSFDVIDLENLASDSETVWFCQNSLRERAVDSIANQKQPVYTGCSDISVCPQIDLSNGWETVLKQSKRADNFKRRLKKLEKTEGFEFRSITSPAEIPEAFERFYYLHEKRWATDGGSELSGHPRLVSFQREVVKNLNLIRFDELWAEGECRASVYGLDNGKTFYYYNAGYDLDWANRSVGLVLIGLSVKNAIERGNVLYDFLRGDETYKFDWANQKNDLLTVNLSRQTIPAIAYGAINRASRRIRNFSKTALPKDLAEKLKTWKRTRQRNQQLKPQAEVL